jgi:hypothetical protein
MHFLNFFKKCMEIAIRIIYMEIYRNASKLKDRNKMSC